jgi:hypothetical protein
LKVHHERRLAHLHRTRRTTRQNASNIQLTVGLHLDHGISRVALLASLASRSARLLDARAGSSSRLGLWCRGLGCRCHIDGRRRWYAADNLLDEYDASKQDCSVERLLL